MAGSFIFGANSLSNFIFNFLGSPLKSLQRTLAPSQPEDSQPTIEQPVPEEHEEHDEQATTEEPVQTEPSQQDDPVSSQMAPQLSVEDLLPTAFTPHFPSLSRPITSHPNQSTLSFAPPGSSRELRSTQNRAPSRRSFYIGPGHSSMNSSSRLGIARRKRLGMSKPSSVVGSNYDAPPPESPQVAAPPQPNHTHNFSEGHTPKRIKVKNYHDNDSDLSLPSQNQLQSEPPPPSQLFSLAPKAENSNLRAIKNSHMTPMRPSPLRNVTLPSAASSPASQKESSPAPLAPSSPMPKKRNHKKAASIMSSVMKEVNLEINNRSPAPSPIKPSNVINPYSHLQQRPMISKPPATQPSVSVKKTVPPPISNPQERETRKRKVQVCLDGDAANHPTDFNQTNSKNSNESSLEQILKKTMPKEFCPDNSNNGAQKKKTGQVGKLPERVLKKQRLREQENTGSKNHPLTSNQSNQSTSSPSLNKPSEAQDLLSSKDNNANLAGKKNASSPIGMKPNQINHSKQPNSASPVKMFQQVPSASLFGSGHLASKSASTRSSLLNAKHQPSATTLNKDKHEKQDLISHSTSVLDSSTSKKRANDHLSTSINHSGIEKEKRKGEKEGTEGEKGVSQREVENREDKGEEEDEEKKVMKLVKELKPEEIRKRFNQDLLVDYSHQPTDSDSLTIKKFNNHNKNDDDNPNVVDLDSIKEVVLGLNSTELTSFILV